MTRASEVGGNPARKSRDPDSIEDSSMVYYCEQGKPEDQVGGKALISCATVAEDGSRYGEQTFTLPTTPCNLLVTKIFMPNCW
jgi:hypothetical protein